MKQLTDFHNLVHNERLDFNTFIPFSRLSKSIVAELLKRFKDAQRFTGKDFNRRAIIDIYDEFAKNIAFMDFAVCAGGLDPLKEKEAKDLNLLFKQKPFMQAFKYIAQVTLSHTMAHKYAQRNSRSKALSKYSLNLPQRVVNMPMPPNQLYLFDMIHKWFEEQIDFQLGFKVLVSDFDPQGYMSQFVTNYCLDHKFYLEILDPELKKYLKKHIFDDDKVLKQNLKRYLKISYSRTDTITPKY